MLTKTKRMKVAGKSYAIGLLDGQVEIKGNGIWGYLPAGITLDAPNLRELVVARIERSIEERKLSNAAFQSFLKIQRGE